MVQTSRKNLEEMNALVAAAFTGIEYRTEAAADELVVFVGPEDVAEAAQICRSDGGLQMDYLRCLSGVDLGDALQVVYHLYATGLGLKLVLKVDLPGDRPTVPTVTGVWLGADWHEREAAELFGIEFRGHPDPRRLLLPEDLIGHPLRKSFGLPKRGRQGEIDLSTPPFCPTE